jgi:hypothetical protein
MYIGTGLHLHLGADAGLFRDGDDDLLSIILAPVAHEVSSIHGSEKPVV